MAKLRHYMTYSVLATVAGVPVGSLAGGLLVSLYAIVIRPWAVLEAILLGLMVSMVAAIIGILPALVYGASIDALLSRRGLANYLSSAAIGVVPGLLALVFAAGWTWFVMFFGACVAIATHRIAKHRLSNLDSHLAQFDRADVAS
ncbi:hypothetical protein [Montanilutibacter psychrotolerans]|uniref:Major facilitator superfamily (MFS) profile domain-containing protein n=1 Tax=Montanilutibacter psychrotolerans TaxID=1327343 RepID=A0A3M8SY41_9GAMM|nr:hypothetical protein [Lysobacter psychrotolerans]RNF86318.1 hypothetical protein EER27_02550 [Lysobacter psychrotolerans]